MPFAGRGARLDKTVTLWRETWNGRGEFADALPPARPGGPPVWLAGGDTTKVIERVAATYDGWLPYLAGRECICTGVGSDPCESRP